MSERDELAKIIKAEYVRAIDRKRPQDCWDAPADAIFAAGYRKPRTITTAEELDALPNGSVIRDSWDVLVKHDNYWRYGDVATEVQIPATVLYEQEGPK